MKKLVRFITGTVYKPLLEKWLSKERVYRRGTIRLRIHPDVFHPGFFFSTKLLLRQLDLMQLKGKRLLELGAGSGLISVTASKKGARVTASDINSTAVAYLRQNAVSNDAPVVILLSDLFDQIPQQFFDIILINPPYYFKEPISAREYAWYCGRNGEYFHRLFTQIGNYMHENTVILMVVCEGDHRKKIRSIAGEYGYHIVCIRVHSNLIEKNFVYRIYAATDNIRKRYEKDTAVQPQEQ